MAYREGFGGRTGGGGVASSEQRNLERKKRQAELAKELIDIKKDPYFIKNHLGGYECRLCFTRHTTEGSYLAHTLGKKHQSNLLLRAQKSAPNSTLNPNTAAIQGTPSEEQQAASLSRYQQGTKRDRLGLGTSYVISSAQQHQHQQEMKPRYYEKTEGIPVFQVVQKCLKEDTTTTTPKSSDTDNQPQNRSDSSPIYSVIVKILYPNIVKSAQPSYRWISSFEQTVEPIKDPNWQYLVVAAEPYENIAIKVPSWSILDQSSSWNPMISEFVISAQFAEHKSKI